MNAVPVILFVLLVFLVFFGRVFQRVPWTHRKRMREAGYVRDLLGRGCFSPAQAMTYLRKINPFAFEELVLDGFEIAGYEVKRNRRYSGDGGVDGRVSKDGIRYLVQCKRYRGYISRQDVEDFSRVCTRECLKGFFVHTGKTGDRSRDTAVSAGNVDIVGGDRMLSVVGYVGNLNSLVDE